MEPAFRADTSQQTADLELILFRIFQQGRDQLERLVFLDGFDFLGNRDDLIFVGDRLRFRGAHRFLNGLGSSLFDHSLLHAGLGDSLCSRLRNRFCGSSLRRGFSSLSSGLGGFLQLHFRCGLFSHLSLLQRGK